MNKESTLYVVLFSLIITFILVLPLTVANELTKAQVDQNKQVASALSILKAMGLPADKTQPQQVIAAYDGLQKFRLDAQRLVPVSNEEIRKASKTPQPIQPLFYKGSGPGGVVWAGAFTGPGLWGNITLALGFDEKIERLTGYQTIAQGETPGLGARISDPWFINQFSGQKIPSSGLFRFVNGSGAGDSDKDNDTVDGVTGATITTNGVRDILNAAVAQMKTLTAGGAQ